MKKQEIIQRFNKQLVVENYSSQTIKSYSSGIKLFLEFVEKLNLDKITEKEIQEYLYFCKKKKNYSFSAMRQAMASIRYLYLKVLHKPLPDNFSMQQRKLLFEFLVFQNQKIDLLTDLFLGYKMDKKLL